jgi:hypothetical protein
MGQPKDFVELKRDDVIMSLTHREIIRLRLFAVGAFVLGFLAGSLIW